MINGLNTYASIFQSRPSDAEPAAIVITGSKQGITNPPGNSAYNASKAAVKTLAEHLSWDLREQKNISVHLLVPGWTFTGLVSATSSSTCLYIFPSPARSHISFQIAAHITKNMNLQCQLQSGNSPITSPPPQKPAGAWTQDQVASYMEDKMQKPGNFYIICPDNDVDEETDKKRMLWATGDIVRNRPPLTRWREEWKEEAGKWLEGDGKTV